MIDEYPYGVCLAITLAFCPIYEPRVLVTFRESPARKIMAILKLVASVETIPSWFGREILKPPISARTKRSSFKQRKCGACLGDRTWYNDGVIKAQLKKLVVCSSLADRRQMMSSISYGFYFLIGLENVY